MALRPVLQTLSHYAFNGCGSARVFSDQFGGLIRLWWRRSGRGGALLIHSGGTGRGGFFNCQRPSRKDGTKTTARNAMAPSG